MASKEIVKVMIPNEEVLVAEEEVAAAEAAAEAAVAVAVAEVRNRELHDLQLSLTYPLIF